VCEEEIEVPEQAPKVRLICRVYEWVDIAVVVDRIADRFRCARDAHAAARRTPRFRFCLVAAPAARSGLAPISTTLERFRS
jgi:hypothetical protein